MPGNIGPLEIAVVLIIVLIIFGPKRLPELGRSMGRGIREFRNSIGGGGDRDKDEDEQERRELESAQAADTTPEPETPPAGASSAPGAGAPPATGGETGSGRSTPSQAGPAAADSAAEPQPGSLGDEKPRGESVEGEIVTDNKA